MIRPFLLLITALWPVTCGDGAAMQQVRGKVGEDVQLTCKINKAQFKGVYIQRKNLSGEYQIFVNGFYSGQSVDVSMRPEYKHRTSFNRTALSLDFWNLTISDEGDYACYVVSHDNSPWIATEFHLTVTADYSVPTLTVRGSSDRGEGQMSYVLHCSSSGGYPRANLTWTVSEGDNNYLVLEEGSKSTTDEHPGVWSIFQTISYNCTKPTNISCSVGDAVSLPLSICPQHSSPPNTVKVIIASVVLFLFIFIFLSAFLMRRLCRSPQQPVDHQPVEVVHLKLADSIEIVPEL